MKTAQFENRTIRLTEITRESFQKIYDDGKKGKLHCPVCGEKVRLYLGILHEPHFYHLSARNQACENPLPPAIEQTRPSTYVERNGFKLPTSRTITVMTPTETAFKLAKAVKNVDAFTKKKSSKNDSPFPYIQLLSKHGTELDEKQQAAVTATDGALLIVAGAGSGKTRVLTARTAFMMQEKKIDPSTIMLVTFTSKAATELKSRLKHYPHINTSQVQKLVAGTFHSIFYRILLFEDREKWHSSKLLKKEWQKEQMIKTAGRQLNLDDKEFAYDLAIQQIGFWKNSLILPSQVRPTSPWEEKVVYLYKQYENMKQEQELFDFDDMLVGCYYLFRDNPALLEAYQNRFHYFLIDEFQDINQVQYELIQMLSAKSQNVCAVGDDDQSIYAFRGSDPKYLLEFEKDFPAAQIILLNENYRSTHEIVSTANRVISKNKERRQKEMHAQFLNQKLPIVFFPYDEEEEATMIVNDMQEKMENGYQPEEFAILFRTNTSSRAIFERLTNSSLPFTIDQDVEPFYERFLVKGMLAFLRLALNEDDQHAIRDCLPALFVKNTILQDLKANSILNDCTLLDCLTQVKTGYAFQEKKLQNLATVIRSLKNKMPVSAIETVEKELGYGDFIKKRGSEGNKLEKGSDDVRDLKVAAKGFTHINDFLDHVDHMSAMNREIKNLSKQQQNAITLSTIHRAKGLEYKVVYLIGVVDGSIPHEYALDSYRNGDLGPMEEERRLLYVAITRAMEELYLSIPDKHRGRKAYPSRFLAPIH